MRAETGPLSTRTRTARAWLASATGVTAAVAYGAFFTWLATPTPSRSPGGAHILSGVLLGSLFGLAVLAFVLTIRTLKTQNRTAWQDGLPVLRGTRVRLRELNRRDARALLRLLSADATAHLPPGPRTLGGVRRFIATMRLSRARGRGCCFGIENAEDRRLIGLVQFFGLPGPDRGLGWGFLLDPALWGHGLFGEAASLALPFAFEVLRAGELQAWVAEENARANRALARLGARPTPMKAARVPDGRTGDFVWWTMGRAGRVE